MEEIGRHIRLRPRWLGRLHGAVHFLHCYIRGEKLLLGLWIAHLALWRSWNIESHSISYLLLIGQPLAENRFLAIHQADASGTVDGGSFDVRPWVELLLNEQSHSAAVVAATQPVLRFDLLQIADLLVLDLGELLLKLLKLIEHLSKWYIRSGKRPLVFVDKERPQDEVVQNPEVVNATFFLIFLLFSLQVWMNHLMVLRDH